MTVYGRDGVESNDPKLAVFHNSREKPIKVICTKDDPPMTGFGRALKKGDIVEIEGTVSRGLRFEVSVAAECAFYDYRYFEEIK